ncbi:MAG: MBL fold metallo-hydrolase [Actinomycetales bacterium]|nr:MBL fold metallo-hydrolase [Actinomycetales bacterium]
MAHATLELRRLDDYQSWQVRWGGTSILIDPWLSGEPIGGSFRREHTDWFVGKELLDRESVAAVLLCTGVSDHARPQTLALLKDQRILGPSGAMAVARKSGCRQITRVKPADVHVVACPDGGTLRITVTRTGLPLGMIAVGYLIEAIDAQEQLGGRIWIDPHLPGVKVAESVAPVDLALLPCHGVRAMVMPVTAGPQTIADVARACAARTIVPTATDPRRDMSTWQRAMYRVDGGADIVQRLLGPDVQDVEVVPMVPGEVRRVEPGFPQRSARRGPTSRPDST